MKTFLKIIVFLAALLAVGVVLAQSKSYEVLNVTPQPLRAGQKANLQVQANKLPFTGDAGPIYAIIFAYKKGIAQSFDVQIPTGKKAVAPFTIPAGTDAIAVKFMQGKQEDNNEGRGYFFEVMDENGQAQTATSYSIYRLYSGDYEAGFTKPNADMAKKYLKDYLAITDPNTLSFYEKAGALFVLRDTVALRKHLNGISDAKGIKEYEFSTLAFYGKLAGPQYAAILQQEKKKRYPEEPGNQKVWWDSLRAAKTAAEKMVWINAYQLAKPEEIKLNNSSLVELYMQLLYFAARSFDYSYFKFASEKIKELQPQISTRQMGIILPFLNQVIDKDSLIYETLPIAREVMLIHKSAWDSSVTHPKPSSSAYLQQLEARTNYYSCASMYSGYLVELGLYDSATYYASLAAKMNSLKSTFYNERYFKAAEKSGMPRQQLLNELEIAFKNEGYSAAMKTMYLALFKNLNNKDGAAQLEKIMFERKAQLREKFKPLMVNKDITAFQLPGLKGGSVSSESLKGKVVLIDFWATWCGPCIASFPTMQRLVDMNKDNKDFVFLFVDVWQKETDKYAVVKDFFKGKSFRLDVYMDLTDEVVKSFGVTGIPTKVILDKNGKLRFYSVGFSGDEEKGMEELQTMMELASEANG